MSQLHYIIHLLTHNKKMTIIQQPDSLSLTRNLKSFLISSDTSFSFTLKKGEEEILSQTYNPGERGLTEIDLRDVVHSHLSFIFKDETEPYQQTNLVADFTAIIDQQEITFRIIRAGVDRLADSAGNFLTQNFLTWQPTVKPVTYYSPEYLTYYAIVSGYVRLKAYFTDENGNVVSNKTIQLAEVMSGIAYTLPMQYSVIVGLLEDLKPAYYDVWVENVSGERLTYIQRYYADNARSLNEDWVLFENSLGGLDCFRAYGTNTLNAEHTHNIAEIEEESVEYRVDTERKFEKNTGLLSRDEARWLLDFFPSQKKYIYTGSYVRPIVVTESNVSGNLRETPANYTFTYKHADAMPLLNLPRTDVPASMLEIIVPEVGNFTVPPRLSEVPRLSLSEGALFPVQNPYNEEWSTTTAAAILTYLVEQLGINYGSGGGVGHTHSNKSLLDLLSYAEEYLLVNGKKIKAGYADVAGDVQGDKFLRKDQEDGTNFLLKFGEFIDSMSAGAGAGIFPDGRGQFEKLEVRTSLSVLEYIYNRVLAMEGDYSFSTSGTIETVTQEADGTYTLKMRRRWEHDFTAFREHDIIYGVVNDLASEDGGYYASWLRVLSVDTVANTLSATLYPDAEVPGGVNHAPEPLMVVTQRGNPVDETRQGWWYLSAAERCLCMLEGVTKPVLEEDNYYVIIGRLKHLSLFDNLPVNYLHSYVFCRGIIANDIQRVDFQGTLPRVANNRGAWSLAVAQGGEPYNAGRQVDTGTGLVEMYDTVWHYGCEWMCLSTGTTDEPKYGAQGWAMVQGNPAFSIDIDSSNGWYFDADKFNTTLSVVGTLYNQDVTASILDADVQWTRDTGDVTEDNAWAVAHAGAGKSITLTVDDLGPNYLTLTGCKFIAKAVLRDGQTELEAHDSVSF